MRSESLVGFYNIRTRWISEEEFPKISEIGDMTHKRIKGPYDKGEGILDDEDPEALVGMGNDD